MHRFLRSIGFDSGIRRSEELALFDRLALQSGGKELFDLDGESLIDIRSVEVCPGSGASVVLTGIVTGGQYTVTGAHPCVQPHTYNPGMEAVISKHYAGDHYMGECVNGRTGLSLIYYMPDLAYIRRNRIVCDTRYKKTIGFSACGVNAMVLYPIEKSDGVRSGMERLYRRRRKAGDGIENGSDTAYENAAIEEFFQHDLACEAVWSKDLYSVVDKTLAPRGVFCDEYRVLGYIEKIEKHTNGFTGNDFYIIDLNTNNDVKLTLAVAENNLRGVPSQGMRLRCDIWLTGLIREDK